MDIYTLLKSRRTARKFKNKPVPYEMLEKFVDTSRLAPSAANLQSLKYKIVTEEKIRREMFPHIRYAGYTPEWENSFEITPASFIVLLNDTAIRPTEKAEVDAGIALMSLTLTAEAEGLASCIIGSVNRAETKKILSLPDTLDILYLIGIGYPDQSNYLCESDEKVKYKLDGKGNFAVPKRTLDDILVR